MKKLFALLLALSMLTLPLLSCSSSLESEVKSETKTEETKTEEKKTEEKKEPLPDLPETWPEGFTVGYNRQDMTPKTFPIYTYDGGKANYAHDPVQLTCTAMCDGEEIFLLLSLDLRAIPYEFVDFCVKKVQNIVDVPKEHIFFNTTHTHSAPDNQKLGEGNMVQWQQLFVEKLEEAVTRSLADLSPARAYIGTGYTEGLTFVRRYLMDDGTYVTNPSTGIAVAHESEADNQMRTIRFDREEGKDVLLVSYQTHYGGATSLYPKSVSADFIHPLRESVEKELDVHFAYQNASGGNLNFNSVIPGERKYPTYEKAIPHMVDVVKSCLAAEQEVSLSKIESAYSLYPGRCWDRSDLEDGFSGKTREVRLYAVTIGEIAFCAFPYEMFDTNGKDCRESSPFKMTFVCANTGGVLSYVPSALAYSHGSYETQNCYFAPGSGEEFVTEMLRLVNECHAKY